MFKKLLFDKKLNDIYIKTEEVNDRADRVKRCTTRTPEATNAVRTRIRRNCQK